MPIEPLAENPFEILVGRIIDGTLPATPEGIALVAWACDFVATDPHFVTLTSTTDGQVFGQQSGDSGPVGKTIVLGVLERNEEEVSQVRAKVITERTQDPLHAEIKKDVAAFSVLYTDVWRGYHGCWQAGYLRRVDGFISGIP